MTNSYDVEIYVRFCETDAVGHVNNTSHFLYFEEARSKFFRMIHPNRQSSSSFILASIKCDYLEQAYAGEVLKVSTNVLSLGNKSFTISHRLLTSDGSKIIAEAEAVTVCFDFTSQKTIPLNAKLKESKS
ncbi:acyl-CoA thioesterase [Oceanobacillus halophilus]|uniref:Acyl-CoA thioesterase n=1 Tax=Oceanobacillus halophilus TaxID=930130 RepID=A0A495A7F7_9BACI|nr:acyl-CoA thioesterase [Oceanobacillus halophilus]RKQ35737.1 acyl-CoA thioesterase [Oceanobacillus halophilus]